MGLGKLGSFEAISSHSDVATFPIFFPSAIRGGIAQIYP